MTDELHPQSLFAYSPAIVRILFDVLRIDRLPVDQRANLEQEIDAIFDAWMRNEDIGELRRLLGVELAPGRRPKWKTMLIESAIAHEVAEQIIGEKKKPAEAKTAIALRHQLEIRKVERAFKKWGDEAMDHMRRIYRQ